MIHFETHSKNDSKHKSVLLALLLQGALFTGCSQESSPILSTPPETPAISSATHPTSTSSHAITHELAPSPSEGPTSPHSSSTHPSSHASSSDEGAESSSGEETGIHSSSLSLTFSSHSSLTDPSSSSSSSSASSSPSSSSLSSPSADSSPSAREVNLSFQDSTHRSSPISLPLHEPATPVPSALPSPSTERLFSLPPLAPPTFREPHESPRLQGFRSDLHQVNQAISEDAAASPLELNDSHDSSLVRPGSPHHLPSGAPSPLPELSILEARPGEFARIVSTEMRPEEGAHALPPHLGEAEMHASNEATAGDRSSESHASGSRPPGDITGERGRGRASRVVPDRSRSVSRPRARLSVLALEVNTPSHAQTRSHSAAPSRPQPTASAVPSSGGFRFPWQKDPYPSFSKRVKTLIQEHRLQEAIWIAEDERANAADVSRLKWKLQQLLAQERVTVLRSSLGGVSPKALIQLKSGVHGLFKPHGGTELGTQITTFAADAYSEVAAYELDRLYGLNIVPMTIPRKIEGLDGSIQVMIQGATAGLYPTQKQTLAHMMILDYLSGNADRNRGNWLYLSGLDRVVAIDHGLAFRNFEGGCIIRHSLFAIFGNRFNPCVAREAEEDLTGVQTASHLSTSSVDLFQDEGATLLNLSWINPSVYEKLLTTAEDEARQALEPWMQPYYLEKLLFRISKLRELLEHHRGHAAESGT